MINIKKQLDFLTNQLYNVLVATVLLETISEEVKMKKEIIKELRMLNNAIHRYIDCYSPVKKEIDEVTCTNGWIIAYLSDHQDEDIYQRDLEKEFGIGRSTISKVIALMEKKGLVAREKVACDDRLKKIVLTEKSQEFAEKIRNDNMEIEGKLIDGFSDEELETLVSYVERLKKNITKY